MAARALSPGELERAYARADQLRAEAERKERLATRRIGVLAQGLADRMEPGMHMHRRSVSLHAFAVDGQPCLAVGYLEEERDEYVYQYAVLFGGEPARRALREAPLDPGASDEPGPHRRIRIATYDDALAFLDRLPTFLADLARDLEARVVRADAANANATAERRRMTRGGPSAARRTTADPTAPRPRRART